MEPVDGGVLGAEDKARSDRGVVPRQERTPLVSYVLYAYNEEKFVREAVESAFSQDYEPLEIFLSDDGSTDGTFAIMEEMARAYAGPHRVYLNKNAANRGIGSQLNAAIRCTRGELLVLANADDVAKTHRVAALVNAWLATGKTAAGIWSSLELADARGRPTGQVRRWGSDFQDFVAATRSRFSGQGATVLALRRDCFERFPPLADNLILEDGPLNLRATWRGGWAAVEEPLVLYRVHSENISQAYEAADYETWQRRHRNRRVWQCTEGQKAFVQMLGDLYSDTEGGPGPEEQHRARVAATARLLEEQLREAFFATDASPVAWAWFRELARVIRGGVKLALKRRFPGIDARNDRWHYRQMCGLHAGQEGERGAK